MKLIGPQRGVGIVEVMVALLLLAIGVLGFTALQLRAVSASMEAGNQVAALNIARDLTERMRANPQATQCKLYHTEGSINSSTKAYTKASNCATTVSSQASAQATSDLQYIYNQTTNSGMSVIVNTCPNASDAGTNLGRQCIYIAWDKTAQSFSSSETCYKNGATSYERNATCIFLEAY